MGRPKDSVFWNCVTKSQYDSTQLICNYCNKEFKGGASRIKIHLSGLGGNIGACTGEVPSHIQEKALKAVNKVKRRKLNTLVGEDNNAVNRVLERGEPSSSPAVIMATASTRVHERGEPSSASALNANFTSSTNEVGGESVADVFVRFFMMNTNVRVDVNDSNFQRLLKSIAQNSTTIEKSLYTFEQEMNQKMQMIKMSWKLTGCSLMIYNLKQGAGELSALNRNDLVVGLYCPRGFIFVEVSPPRSRSRFNNYQEILWALEKNDLGLSWEKDVVMFFEHYTSNLAKCHYQEWDISGVTAQEWVICIQHDIEKFCMTACEKSEWLQRLIQKSDKIYEHVVNSSFYGKFHKQKRVTAVGKTAISISCLGLVLELEDELKTWLSKPQALGIITSDEFWGDGKELMEALRPLLHIPQLMDTLVPTTGYLEAAIDGAKHQLKLYSEQKPVKFSPIWDAFEEWIKDRMYMQYNISYLTPGYVLSLLRSNVQGRLIKFSIEKEEEDLYVLFCLVSGNEVQLRKEMKAYRVKSQNPFTNVSIKECQENHPVILWTKYGGQFPLLQRCAYKLLSQPVSCLCNQVEKHMSKLQGADNYVLRLNALMMEEFSKIGDQVYQPFESFISTQSTIQVS